MGSLNNKIKVLLTHKQDGKVWKFAGPYCGTDHKLEYDRSLYDILIKNFGYNSDDYMICKQFKQLCCKKKPILYVNNDFVNKFVGKKYIINESDNSLKLYEEVEEKKNEEINDEDSEDDSDDSHSNEWTELFVEFINFGSAWEDDDDFNLEDEYLVPRLW